MCLRMFVAQGSALCLCLCLPVFVEEGVPGAAGTWTDGTNVRVCSSVCVRVPGHTPVWAHVHEDHFPCPVPQSWPW